LADYRDRYDEIRATGSDVAAVSVDPPEASEAVRRDLRLSFMILCDTERRVVREWNVYNPRERGGIAKPAVFIVDSDRTVRYASLDGISSRIAAQEIVRLLRAPAETPSARRKHYIATPLDFLRGIRNAIRFRRVNNPL
jgi:peroxiredoxin